jgi:hypothetical protein
MMVAEYCRCWLVEYYWLASIDGFIVLIDIMIRFSLGGDDVKLMCWLTRRAMMMVAAS